MSGIVGIYHMDGRPVEETEVRRMLAPIAYRGPDGAGVWTSGSIGLGHQMLWTTPESLHETQPLTNEDGSLCLVADARVDNCAELRTDLLAHGARLRDDTDAELILRSYEVWGESCPAKIIGDFAFAIWDARRRRLMCTRDPLGIKPFYFCFDGKTFRWASAPQGIFSSGPGAIAPQPNLRQVCQTLLNRFDEREETLYKDIFRLPPAHRLIVEGDRLRKERYWELDPEHAVRYDTDAEYAEHFQDLFRTAVAARLRSHGPVGSILSGGLDSSAVVCVAQELNRENGAAPSGMEAFSIVFDTMACDERPYIADVVKKCGVGASQFVQEEHASWLDFENVQRYPEAYYTPTLFMLGPALEAARRNGIRSVMTGVGGDDITASSVVHLTDLARQRRIGDLIRQLRHDAHLASRSQWSLFRDFCLKPMVPASARSMIKSMVKPLRRTLNRKWLTDECLRQGDATVNGSAAARFKTAVQQQMSEKLQFGWNTTVALARMDAFAAHFAVEFRHPFFDRRLVEFMMAVPEEQRWFGPWRKTILRAAMIKILPESVRCRNNKADFTPLVEREFKQRQAAKAQELLRATILGEWGLIDAVEIQQLFKRYQQASTSHAERKACQNVIGLELWYRSTIQTS